LAVRASGSRRAAADGAPEGLAPDVFAPDPLEPPAEAPPPPLLDGDFETDFGFAGFFFGAPPAFPLPAAERDAAVLADPPFPPEWDPADFILGA
jgi:hypothetical protein